jgi:hypothetical protein
MVYISDLRSHIRKIKNCEHCNIPNAVLIWEVLETKVLSSKMSFHTVGICVIHPINVGTFNQCWYRMGFKRATFYKF